MTTWEIEDSTAGPLDLVLEQDFILRVRRLHRLGTAHLVINLALSAIGALIKSVRTLESVQKALKEFAKVTNGALSEMSNGDVFIIWEETGDAEMLVSRLMSVLPVADHEKSHTANYLLTYHMPQDYMPLRERANHYVEIVRASSTMSSDAPAEALKSTSARGPLTAWGVDQISKLLDDIDVRSYARTQSVYRLEGGALTPVAEEYFISFDDLRRERFPKFDIVTPEHLFLALCEIVDQKLLASMADSYATIMGKAFHLNLSVASVIGSAFAKFTHAVPRDKRGLLTFELHRGDLFQDFSRTLDAVKLLHMEGFKVALDSITPDMLPYINCAAFGADAYKINVSGERVGMLSNAAIRKELTALPADKIIFFRCDSDRALAVGRELGIKLFQGWHIDDVAAHTKR